MDVVSNFVQPLGLTTYMRDPDMKYRWILIFTGEFEFLEMYGCFHPAGREFIAKYSKRENALHAAHEYGLPVVEDRDAERLINEMDMASTGAQIAALEAELVRIKSLINVTQVDRWDIDEAIKQAKALGSTDTTKEDNAQKT